MPKFRVIGFGRKVGAIGMSGAFCRDLESESAEAARLDIYNHFEHISGLRVIPLPENDSEYDEETDNV